jgi:hypothetical protein
MNCSLFVSSLKVLRVFENRRRKWILSKMPIIRYLYLVTNDDSCKLNSAFLLIIFFSEKNVNDYILRKMLYFSPRIKLQQAVNLFPDQISGLFSLNIFSKNIIKYKTKPKIYVCNHRKKTVLQKHSGNKI